MKRFITAVWMFVVLGGLVFSGGEAELSEDEALEEIMAIEVGTYDDYYYNADPTAYAELFGKKGTYFDPWLDHYHEDEAVKESLLAWKGKIPKLDYEVLNPRLDLYGDTAILIFNLNCMDPGSGKTVLFWKGTTVYTRSGDSWQKVHAHWSTSTPSP